MLIKICGVKNTDAIDAAVKAGANFIGFNLSESKRQVTVEEAVELRQRISAPVKTVGVFVDTPIDQVNEIARRVGLDYVQLHGNEPVSDCMKSDRPVIKAIWIETNNDLDKVIEYAPNVDYLLLKSPGSGQGEFFNWSMIDSIPFAKEKLILSGGMSPWNVKAAIKIVDPSGVDVSTGVETNGSKDLWKIQKFIENVRDNGDSTYELKKKLVRNRTDKE